MSLSAWLGVWYGQNLQSNTIEAVSSVHAIRAGTQISHTCKLYLLTSRVTEWWWRVNTNQHAVKQRNHNITSSGMHHTYNPGHHRHRHCDPGYVLEIQDQSSQGKVGDHLLARKVALISLVDIARCCPSDLTVVWLDRFTIYNVALRVCNSACLYAPLYRRANSVSHNAPSTNQYQSNISCNVTTASCSIHDDPLYSVIDNQVPTRYRGPPELPPSNRLPYYQEIESDGIARVAATGSPQHSPGESILLIQQHPFQCNYIITMEARSSDAMEPYQEPIDAL